MYLLITVCVDLGVLQVTTYYLSRPSFLERSSIVKKSCMTSCTTFSHKIAICDLQQVMLQKLELRQSKQNQEQDCLSDFEMVEDHRKLRWNILEAVVKDLMEGPTSISFVFPANMQAWYILFQDLEFVQHPNVPEDNN